MDQKQELCVWFDALVNHYKGMGMLPHEMVRWQMEIATGTQEERLRLRDFWAEYLEQLAKLVREVELVAR